jgi:GNAT superfamily N-acetyltransferase
MSDDWMPLIKLPLTAEQFLQLPRNPAYKYEYLGRKAYLTPRPRHYHAWLDLQPIEAPGLADLRPLRADDLPGLERLFAAAFRTIQPFGSLCDADRLRAARQALARTRTGGDGPLVEQACFVAYEEGEPVGALLVTLLPPGDPADWDSYHWTEPPPLDCVAQRLGRPHLTWIFVAPHLAGHGLGTSLLAAAVHAIMALGYRELLSTFVLGNESSMLWHWRNGFRLLPYPGSYRIMQQRWQELAKQR